MKERISKRIVSLFLAVLTIMAFLPTVTLPSFAKTTGSVTGLSDENIGLSFDGTAGDIDGDPWSAGGMTVTGTVISTGIFSQRKFKSTLTIKNKMSVTATLLFDYVIERNDGTIKVGEDVVTGNGSFIKKLSPRESVGDSVDVFIESGSKTNATTITLKNIKLLQNVTATATFLPAENGGSYSVNDKTVTKEYSNKQSSLNAYKLVAAPADGYKFDGWYNVTTGNYISADESASLNIDKDCKITAKFVRDEETIFEVNVRTFGDLNAAVLYAQNTAQSQITLVKDGTVSGNYAIPAGITLLIPFDEAKTLYKETPEYTTTAEPPKVYRTLTMASGSSIVVNGSISVGGKHYTTSSGACCKPTGAYGLIKMQAGSNITLNNGAALFAWGYIVGDGNITANSGSKVYEYFQITDWRGGRVTTAMNGNNEGVFPFSQYYVQNIEAALTLKYGAREHTYVSITASVVGTQSAIVQLFGSSGLFSVEDGGQITKKYDPKTDRMSYTISGNASLNSVIIDVNSVKVDSASYNMPINSNMDIVIASGTTTLKNNTALLPGVKISIAKDAELKVANGASLYVYDNDEWKNNYVYGNQGLTQVHYSPSGVGKRTLSDVTIDVNGVFTAEGSVYTTESGADICSSKGTGKYIQKSAPGTATVTHQCNGQSPDALLHKYSLAEIPITPAKLHNADGSYTDTKTAKAGDTINYVSGVWGGTPCAHENTELRNAKDATCTVPGYTGDTYCKACGEIIDSGEVILAKGHTEEILNAKEATLTEDGYTGDTFCAECGILIKNGEVIPKGGVIVSWVVEGKTVKTETCKKGEKPKYTGEVPAKAETSRYTYEFSGWTPGISEATEDVTYTAQFTAIGKNGLCVEGDDTYWIKDGVNVEFPGLIRINVGTDAAPHYHYYYFGEDDKAVKDGDYKVDKNNGLPLPCYKYRFNADGIIEHDEDTSKNGICDGDGSKFYYIDGVKVGEGLIRVEGSYYYARTSTAEIVRNCSYWVTKTNKFPIKEGTYKFDADGRMIINGFVEYERFTYYYDNGTLAKGFTKIGDDYYFFNAASGKMYKDANMWVGDNPYGIEGGMYYFNETGKMVLPDVENGEKKIVEKDGKLYLMIDKSFAPEGLYEVNGEYYYAQTNGLLAVDKAIYATTELLDGNGWYRFGADGKLIKNGFADCGEFTFYFTDGKRAKGFTKIGEDYYIFNDYSGKMYKDANMWVGDNQYGIEGGMYYFNETGKMVLPDVENGEKRIVEKDGKLYLMIDKSFAPEGLYEVNGEYYYAQTNGLLAVDKAIYATTELLDGNGWYRFGSDGKLITDGFVECDGKTFYFADGIRAKGFTKIENDYYIFNAKSGMMYKNANMWVGSNDYGIKGGLHYFGEDGKMADA